MMSRVPFASCYVYSPQGRGVACERSRLMRSLLKARDTRFMLIYAERVRSQALESELLSGFFSGEPVLVPVPGSVPRARGRLSVPEILAQALVAETLGQRTWPGLRRVHAVPKSATCAAGSRPTVGAHYDSMAVEAGPALVGDVVLIDDVVTKGRTLLAAATRLQEAFPSARIRAFALLRTLGNVQGVDRLLDPCVGEIRWRAGDAQRTP
jgi:phosphoribosylpyrophosphate synthetase